MNVLHGTMKGCVRWFECVSWYDWMVLVKRCDMPSDTEAGDCGGLQANSKALPASQSINCHTQYHHTLIYMYYHHNIHCYTQDTSTVSGYCWSIITVFQLTRSTSDRAAVLKPSRYSCSAECRVSHRLQCQFNSASSNISVA